MKTLRLVLGDQLSLNLSSLSDLDRENDVVLLDLLVGYGANASAMVKPLGSPMHVGV